MKKLITCVILLIFSAGSELVFGQNEDSLTIEDLKLPVYPGFQILGVSPQEISRPTNVQALNAILINSVTSPNGLADDFAIDMAPYWLIKHPTLSFDCFYGFEECTNGKGGNVFLQSLSISIASTAYENSADSLDGRSWGFGAKATILRGKPSTKATEKAKRMIYIKDLNLQAIYGGLDEEGEDAVFTSDDQDDIINAVKTGFQNVINFLGDPEAKEFLTGIQNEVIVEIKSKNIDTASEAIEFFKQKSKATEIEIKEGIQVLTQEDLKRVGLNVEVAVGSAIVLPQNDLDGIFLNKYGAWVTASYTLDKYPSLSAALLIRRLSSSQDIGSKDTDIGLSFAIERPKYAVNFEGIHRNTREDFLTTDSIGNTIPTYKDDTTYRFTFNSVFKVTDDLKFTLTIGKDYDSEIRVSENTLALIGIDLNLFKDIVMK